MRKPAEWPSYSGRSQLHTLLMLKPSQEKRRLTEATREDRRRTFGELCEELHDLALLLEQGRVLPNRRRAVTVIRTAAAQLSDYPSDWPCR